MTPAWQRAGNLGRSTNNVGLETDVSGVWSGGQDRNRSAQCLNHAKWGSLLANDVQMRAMDLSPESKRILFWICLLIAANQIGFGMIIPVIALYAEDFGVSKTAIGLTIAVYGLARFVANVPAGQLADRDGRKTTLAVGGMITVVGAVLCAVAPNYGVFRSLASSTAPAQRWC